MPSANPLLVTSVHNPRETAAAHDAQGACLSITDSVPRTSEWGLIGVTGLITAGLIFAMMHLLNKADDTRLIQIAIGRIEAHANLISSTEWEATARREVTEGSLAELSHAENEIVQATQVLTAKKEHIADAELFRNACSKYVQNIDRQVRLIEAGEYEEARQTGTVEVDPSFHQVQRLIDRIEQEQSVAVEETAIASRISLIAAALFAIAMILIYFRRFNAQRYRTEMALIERRLAREAQELLALSASQDPLTRLPNRAVVMDRLQVIIERRKRHPGGQTAVLFVDLDDLKVINDGLGHDAGDLLISEFAKRIRACVRSEDTVARPLNPESGEADLGTVARLGGDEFIVLIEEVNDPSDALRVAQRIQAVMKEPFMLQGQEVFKGVSIGIAFSSGDIDARSLVANADIAMYRAKAKGKSRCEVFDVEMHTQITRRLDLEKALRQAVEEKQFRLQYQPIVSLATGEVEGFEALVRWQKPGVGFVSPGDFIPIAEETGLVVPLGEWVLTEACHQAASWRGNDLRPGPYVSVNVSARQFAYPGFVDQVREALRLAEIDPHRLKVELTEGTAMEDPERAVDVMLQLAELGITLSLDDFGTGYSSLSVLRRFPVKTLKIDRSFVSAIHTNHQVAAIVATIIDLARILCMEVVAEGVETREQMDKLKSSFCDCAQGYLFSVPLSIEAIPEMIGINLMTRLEGKRAIPAAAAH